MNRRHFLQTAAIGGAVAPGVGFAQDADEGTGPFELVVHTVHDAVRRSSPLQIYSGLLVTLDFDELLVEAAGGTPAVEIWNDWNDYDLRQVFGAFIVGTPDVSIGSYRIYDTPDIAHGVHQPMVDEIEQGYVPVGGYRASRMVAGGFTFTSLRIWNVIIGSVAEDEEDASDVMLGMVRHLGRAVGALD